MKNWKLEVDVVLALYVDDGTGQSPMYLGAKRDIKNLIEQLLKEQEEKHKEETKKAIDEVLGLVSGGEGEYYDEEEVIDTIYKKFNLEDKSND